MFKFDHGRWYRHVWLTVLLCIMPLTGCSDEDPTDRVPMTPEEVQTFKFRSTVEGIDFDVPVNYHYGMFEAFKVWPRPPRVQLDGRVRRKADTISIDALLPDIEPYTETNAAEFAKPGWGRKIDATIIKRRRHLANWQYFFDTVGPSLKRLPDSPEVPGMLYYRDTVMQKDIYLSHDHPVEGLIKISCKDKEQEWQHPSCWVWTTYSDRFDLDLRFGRPYLGQWREIERKVKAVFDGFRASAQQQSKSK